MQGPDSRQGLFPKRISSAPPDQGQPHLKDSPKKPAFNSTAEEFVPGAISIPKSEPTKWNPTAYEFVPGGPTTTLPSSLQPSAKEFVSVNFSPSASEFIPTISSTSFEPSTLPSTTPFIQEADPIQEPILEEEESDDDYSSDSDSSSDSYIKVEKVNGKYVYDYDIIWTLKDQFENHSDFKDIDQELSAISQRTILIKRREHRHNTKKMSQKDREWREKERQAQQPMVLNWRREKTKEEEKIFHRARAHTEKLKANIEDEEKIKRQVRVTLNKLSPNNLDKLQDQLLNIARESYEKMGLLVKGIFDKAWSEQKYTQMYAKLCGYFKEQFEGFKYPGEESKSKNHFKHKLLHICEEAFSYNPDDNYLEGLNEEQKENKRTLLKKKTLGNVRFIGELFNVKLITARVVLQCVHDLVGLPGKHDPPERVISDQIDEDKLEGACILLGTGGISFERSMLKPETNRIFDYLESLLEHRSGELSNKLRFFIMNLMDERKNNWEKSNKEEVKKIEDIHAEFHREQNEIAKRHENRR